MEKRSITAIRCLTTERWLLLQKDDGLWCFPEADLADAMFSISHACVAALSAIGEITNITLLAVVNESEQPVKTELHLYFTTLEEERAINLIEPYKKFAWMKWSEIQELKKIDVSPVSEFAMRVFEAVVSDG